MLRRIFCIVVVALLALWPSFLLAANLTNIGLSWQGGVLRLTMSFDEAVGYSYFTLDNPSRLVIDVPNARWRANLAADQGEGGVVSGIRHGYFKPEELRVVADLNQAVSPKISTIAASNKNPFRIVADLEVANAEVEDSEDYPAARHQPENKLQSTKKTSGNSAYPLPQIKPEPPSKKAKPVIIIDPGHGGHDSGAISRHGVMEKEITLEYALKLRDALNGTGRYKAYLTRDGDEFLKLRERIAVAKKKGGDVFISLHADSHPDRETRGFSVYTLSESASDKEAEMLAQRENRSDVISGINLDGQSPEVAGMLIELAQRDTMNKSADLARALVAELTYEEIMSLRNTHRSAGFAVLKSPDMPSVLLEMGFLTNAKDERQLRSKEFEKKLVTSLVAGMDRYFKGDE